MSEGGSLDGRVRLRAFVLAHLGLPMADFRRRHPHPFLLLRATHEVCWTGIELRAAFAETGPGAFANLRQHGGPGPTGPGWVARDLLVPILARRPSVPPGGITVGREGTNDLVLRFERVSPHHATLEPRDDGRGVEVIDAGSTHGTFVNGTRLRSGERVRLLDGARLEFGGGLPFTFLTPEGLHRALPALVRHLREE